MWDTMPTLRNELGKIDHLKRNLPSCGGGLPLQQLPKENRGALRARERLKTRLKCMVLANWWRYAFYIQWNWRCFHLIDSNLENYTGTLEVIISSNIRFYLTHFFINVIAIFVLEIRDSRCRSAGAISGILGHDLQGFQTEKTRELPMWDKPPKSNLLLKSKIRTLSPKHNLPAGQVVCYTTAFSVITQRSSRRH